MKSLIILTFVLFSFGSQAQSWAAKAENAQFEINVNNVLAYTSEVKLTQGVFTDDEFELVSDRCLTKDGVFRMELSTDKSTITIYYLEWIDHWTINWLFTEGSPSLENRLRIHPKTEFTL
jgi:hypothetical protein